MEVGSMLRAQGGISSSLIHQPAQQVELPRQQMNNGHEGACEQLSSLRVSQSPTSWGL